jgi:DNA-binding MarR family transcriptional regulator
MNCTDKLGDLVIEVYKNLKTKVERDLKEYEIGMGQLQILMVFFNEIEGSLTQNELVKVLGVDKGNISRSLLKLSAKGYLEQVEGKKLYRLSEKGKHLKAEIISIFININSSMIHEIESMQIDQTIQTLNKINKNLEKSI